MNIGFVLSSGFIGGAQTNVVNLANNLARDHAIKLYFHKTSVIDPSLKTMISPSVKLASLVEILRTSDVIQIDHGFPLYERKKLFGSRWRDTIIYYHSARVSKVERYCKFLSPPTAIANSRDTGERLKRSCEVIEAGVDLNLFEPLNIKKRYDIAIIGRLRPIKNHRFFIEIAKRGGFRFLVIGGSSRLGHINEIESFIRNNAIPGRDKVTGNIDQRLLIQQVCSAKVALCLSEDEGLGYNIVEPMACGVPVIARNVGGAKEALIDFPDCLVEPSATSETFVDRINQLIRNPIPVDDLRASVKLRFSLDIQIKRLLEVYETVISR